MMHSTHFWRSFLFILLIAILCGSLAVPASQGSPVRAAPQFAPSTTVVISQVYGGGGNSGATYTNDFVELFNLGSRTETLDGWTIQYAGATSASWTVTNLSGSIAPGQNYLVELDSGGANGNSLPTPDATGTLTLAATAGKVALVRTTTALTCGSSNDCLPNTDIIDFVGYGSTANSFEGSGPAPAPSSNNNQADIRNGNSCSDTDNNSADFTAATPDPRNASSRPLPCLRVIKVTSPVSDVMPFKAGASIDITVTFSNLVNVSGIPTLLLETGVDDHAATYTSGSGTNTLTFNYIVVAGDATNDLDYVSTSSLSLNGGSITGAIGDAALTLPDPGSPESLAGSKSIKIDNGLAPSVVSIRRQTPGVEQTNNDSLTFRVTFSEAVRNVDVNDFVATSAIGNPASVNRINDSTYDVRFSGGTLTDFNGIVGLDLSAPPAQDITDINGTDALVITPLSVDETYTVDNVVPDVTVNQALGQADPTDVLPVHFTVVFSEVINVSSFTPSDISQSGISSVTWNITNPSGDQMTFDLSATAVGSNGNLRPSISAGRVQDLADNNNTASTSTPPDGNLVVFNDITPPTVTISQTTGQADPTSSLPVRFTAVFSEPIDTRVFASGDITNPTGTATGITWNIADSGDHTTFTLSATAVTGIGTIIPFIAANRVTDLVGNNNVASTNGTDNSVNFTSAVVPTSVVISEFRTRGPSGADDEFIELYNPTTNLIDISGWKINASNDTGSVSTRATIPASTILRSGQYYLIANNASGGYSNNVAANLTYGTGISDAGGIALLTANNAVVDQVGLGSGSFYKEGTTLSKLSGEINQSYERKLGGASGNCQDTADNTRDFKLLTPPADPSNPQNYGSQLNLCGTVITSFATTTTITADSPDPSLVNGSVSVSVSVTGGSPAPTGKVNITGTNSNCTVTLNSSGTGSCTVRFTTTGAKTLYATYIGDNTHLGSQDSEPHQVSTSIVPTATARPLPPPPLIAINEFVPRPDHDWNLDGVVNTGDEYIEILNHGVVDVNLSGYTLDDEANVGSSPYRLPAVVMKPGERKVFYGSETGLLLSDGGDGVRLLKPNGQLGDAYNYFVVRFPDQSYCRLPDNGGLDDWNQNCFPTPGLQNSMSKSVINPPTSGGDRPFCPIADTLPDDFVFAECQPLGSNIWNPAYWDRFGWFGDKFLPGSPGKWSLFGD